MPILWQFFNIWHCCHSWRGKNKRSQSCLERTLILVQSYVSGNDLECYIWNHVLRMRLWCTMQTGTKESTAQEVGMGQIDGLTLTALISFMYGRLDTIPANILLPLFVAADAHQARTLPPCCQCFKQLNPRCSLFFWNAGWQAPVAVYATNELCNKQEDGSWVCSSCWCCHWHRADGYLHEVSSGVK